MYTISVQHGERNHVRKTAFLITQKKGRSLSLTTMEMKYNHPDWRYNLLQFTRPALHVFLKHHSISFHFLAILCFWSPGRTEWRQVFWPNHRMKRNFPASFWNKSRMTNLVPLKSNVDFCSLHCGVHHFECPILEPLSDQISPSFSLLCMEQLFFCVSKEQARDPLHQMVLISTLRWLTLSTHVDCLLI